MQICLKSVCYVPDSDVQTLSSFTKSTPLWESLLVLPASGG